MFTRQNLLDAVKEYIPQAYTSAGIGPMKNNYWDQWVIDGLSTSRNRWLNLYNSEGKWTTLLANTILLSFNLSSIGYNQPDKRQAYGDQLRAYVAIAQSVVDGAVAMITSLQIQLSQETDTAKKAQLVTELQNEETTCRSNIDNLTTEKNTLAAAIKAGQAI